MSKRLATMTLFVFAFVLSLALTDAQAQPSKKKNKASDPCKQGTAYRNCPACGTVRPNSANPAKATKQRWLNVRKNRDPKATNVRVLTVQAIRDPQNDQGKFNEQMAVEVVGYVAGLDDGGNRETCNCKRGDLRDLHINVVAAQGEETDPRRYVVVEITPRWQKKYGMDDSNYDAMKDALTTQLKGKWVRFRGWMMYDYIHVDASESTSPGKAGNWRATPWEVHPVTSYEVLSGPPH
jgi:hypothetical protein